jgi:hypothetical protein
MRRPWIILSALAMAGCVNSRNDRMAVGEDLRLEAISAQPRPAPPSASEQVLAPSLTGISRANWSKTLILVPVDGTVHYPIYARRVFWADQTARQRGEYPTAYNSLEMIEGSETSQDYEALNNQARAVLDLLFMVPRMIAWAPWRDRRSPDESYQRYNHPERPEVTPVAGEPQSVTP